MFLAGVGAQYESEVVYHQIREDLEKEGVIFTDMDTGLREYEEVIREHFASVIPANDNMLAALNSAVWSGGSFVYVPKGVKVEMPLQAYFRINTENMGQFERTLIIADEDSDVHYIEGCTAPVYSTDSLHSAVVELIARPGSRIRYTTVQNWSQNVFNLVTKRATAAERATVEWVDCNLGSKVTMKYPSIYLMGEEAHGEILSIAFAGKGQHQDAGGKIIHAAPKTTSSIFAKSISKDGGRSTYRGLLEVAKGATEVKSKVVCDALLLDEHSRSDTYPTIRIDENDANVGHEASVSKIGEEQLFYLQSRGLSEEEAVEDDRQRLHRAGRQGAADGVRGRAQPADRAADGRQHRLVEAATSTTPDWLVERRSQALETARGLSLPGPKVRGWEFTDLSKLDLSAYEPAEAAADAPEELEGGVLAAPEGARSLTQVDASTIGDFAPASGNGRPDSPLVMPLDAAAARFPELVRSHLGTIVKGDEDPFVTINEAGWSGGALVYVPRNVKLEEPISLTAIQQAAGKTLTLAHPRDPRGGRRGRDLGALPLGRREHGRALQRRHRARRRPRRQPPLRLRAVALPRLLDLRQPARRGRQGREPRLGRARARRRQRQGPDGDQARRPRRLRQGHRRHDRQRPPAPRLRHHAGARGRGHDLRASPSAASLTGARPPSGAG